MALMKKQVKKSLPDYAIECFMYSGYNTAWVVAQMNTKEGSNNTINKIEAFILQNFPLDEPVECHQMSLPCLYTCFATIRLPSCWHIELTEELQCTNAI